MVPKISDVPILNRVHSILATWRVLDALTFEDSRIGCDRLRLWLLRCCHWSFWGLVVFVCAKVVCHLISIDFRTRD